MSDEQLG